MAENHVLFGRSICEQEQQDLDCVAFIIMDVKGQDECLWRH